MQHFGETLSIGQIDLQTVQLTAPILEASFSHAQQIARELGLSEAESSMAAYWSLADRVQQWQTIFDRVERTRTRQLRIVEVGSGLGLFVLVGKLLGMSVLGVESSSDRYQLSLRIAQALCLANQQDPTFVNGYAEALPLPSASADIVISFHTFEHVHSLNQSLCEIRRVLKPGGFLFAQVPNYTSLYEPHYGLLAPLGLGKPWLRRLVRLYGRPSGFLEHLQWLTPTDLRRSLLQAGFRSVRITPIQRSAQRSIVASYQPLPFRFRRGRLASRLARMVALLGDQLPIGANWHPNIEIWAEA